MDHGKIKLQFLVLLDIDLFFLLAALIADGAAGLAGRLAAGLALTATGSVRLGQRFRIDFLNMFHQKCTSNAVFLYYSLICFFWQSFFTNKPRLKIIEFSCTGGKREISRKNIFERGPKDYPRRRHFQRHLRSCAQPYYRISTFVTFLDTRDRSRDQVAFAPACLSFMYKG